MMVIFEGRANSDKICHECSDARIPKNSSFIRRHGQWSEPKVVKGLF